MYDIVGITLSLAHYFLNPSYQHLNITHAVIVVDFFVPSITIGIMIYVFMYIMILSHCIHSKTGSCCVSGISLLAGTILVVVLFCVYFTIGNDNISFYYTFSYFILSSINLIPIFLNAIVITLFNKIELCSFIFDIFRRSRNKIFCIVCVIYIVIIFLYYLMVVSLLLSLLISRSDDLEVTINQTSWEDTINVSYISIGTFIFFAFHLPLNTLVFFLLTVISYKMYVAVKHHTANNELQEDSVPIRSFTGSDYGSVHNNNNMVNLIWNNN